MEIERKFLVSDKSLNLDRVKEWFIIEQYYLSYLPEIRLRCKTDMNNQKKCYITIKSDGDLIREEKEIEIPIVIYIQLKDCHLGNIIVKKRCLINLDNDLLAELDFYLDNLEGLQVVEVEFNSKEEADNFNNCIPSWFGQEITYDKKYKNKNLSKNVNK